MKKIEITKFYWQFNGSTEVVDFSLVRGHHARPSFQCAEIEVEQPGRDGKLSFCFRHEVLPCKFGTDPFLCHMRHFSTSRDQCCLPAELSGESPWFTCIFPFHFVGEGDNSSLAMQMFKDAMEYFRVVPPDNWGFPPAVVTQRTEVEMKGIRIPFGTFKSAQYYPVTCPLYARDHAFWNSASSAHKVNEKEEQPTCFLCNAPLSKIPKGGDRGYEWHHPFGPTFSIEPLVGIR